MLKINIRRPNLRSFAYRWIGIPFMLVALWIFVNVFYIINSEKSPSVLPVHHSIDSFSRLGDGRLLKNRRLKGFIRAEENYFGILSVRFTPSNLVFDKIVFRLRERGESRWYYQRVYDTTQFYVLPLYPFGFPIIDDSQGKTYEFEIQSLEGTEYNAVEVSRQEPVLISKYKFPVTLLLTQPDTLFNFMYKKGSIAVRNPNFYYINFLSVLVLLMYPLWHLYLSKRIPEPVGKYLFMLTKTRYVFAKLAIALVFIEIFIIEAASSAVTLLAIAAWILALVKHKIDDASSLVFAIILWGLTTLLSLIGTGGFAAKAADWTYILLIIGVGQYLLRQIPVKLVLTKKKQ